ncbi:hypothetical protein [Mycobacterium sp.]|jgi:hypothetical protein|uniref:hypothetical protein n=1 Tax=Mycobacterium sp. TaxID=1785 RepID=UPI002D4A28A3|nr:hypothetical protein [Mycobacterium sp.]HZA09007.1 hypothetical protein [Mycobacterium sp.]
MARKAYAHDAVVVVDPGGDPAAPGGAVTVALCGHWDHPPPCPLAPHHTAARPAGDTVELRVLFATEPANEKRVRSLIGEALATGRLNGPDGHITRWTVRSAQPALVRPDEEDDASRLIANP